MKKICLLAVLLPFCYLTDAQTQNCTDKKHPMPVFSDSIRNVFEKNAAAAYEKVKNDNSNAEYLIWYGRRLAYLGKYREAIEAYTKGISLFPTNARFLRHRGHRYISLRCLDEAIRDLELATQLIKGQIDEIEADGMPNALNIPTSTLFSNIWYHLGLAYYLKGDYRNALSAYTECLHVSDNNDMYVATLNWLNITLRKLGNDKEADQRIKNLDPGMELIENHEYFNILMMYKTGDDSKLAAKVKSETGLSNATLGFGLGTYYLLRGEKQKAKEIYEKVVSGNQWASFGYIAAEFELERMK